MARKWQIDTPAQIGGLLEALGGLTVTGALTLGSQASATTHGVRADRSISAGTGLSGGGNLTADRTLSFDTTWGDARYLTKTGGTITGTISITENITFNNDRGLVGLTTTGAFKNLISLSSNNSIYVGATDQALVIQGVSSPTYFNGTNSYKMWTELNDGSGSGLDADTVDGVHLAGLVQTSRTITAGTGLTGGGDLSANRTLAVSFAGTGSANTAARSDHNHDTTYLKLSGGALTGFISVEHTAAIPLTLTRTGNATNTTIEFKNDSGSVFAGMGSPVTFAIGPVADLNSGAKFTVAAGTGNTSILGTLSVTGATALGTQATSSSHAVRADRSISAGSGLTGGGNLTADRSLAVSFAGTGSATTVARSDHDHDTVYAKLSGASFTGAITTDTRINLPMAGYLTWTLQHGTGSSYLYVSPSATVNGTDFDFNKGIKLGTDDISFNGNPLWHTGNDGAGSGLDADTVDGIQGASLVQTSRSISAGSGLTGGGNLTADRSLAVSFAGTGSATTVARSDHNHDTTYAPIANPTFTGTAIVNSLGGMFQLKKNANVLGQLYISYKNSSNAEIAYVGFGNTADDIFTVRNVVAGAALNLSTNGGEVRIEGNTAWHSGNDGASSGLDADLLDGQHGSYYLNASYMNAGTLNDARLSTNIPKLNAVNTFSGVVKLTKNVFTVTFAAGETRKTVTHNMGTTNYVVTYGTNSVARHVAYENPVANTVDIVIDSPYTELIGVSVVVIPY